mgnify:CR=1 FL=1
MIQLYLFRLFRTGTSLVHLLLPIHLQCFLLFLIILCHDFFMSFFFYSKRITSSFIVCCFPSHYP